VVRGRPLSSLDLLVHLPSRPRHFSRADSKLGFTIFLCQPNRTCPFFLRYFLHRNFFESVVFFPSLEGYLSSVYRSRDDCSNDIKPLFSGRFVAMLAEHLLFPFDMLTELDPARFLCTKCFLTSEHTPFIYLNKLFF